MRGVKARVPRPEIRLWLDDLRPAPVGWTWAKSVAHAKQLLRDSDVVEASLDHDLGACEGCTRREEARRGDTARDQAWDGMMPHCTHVGTGYDLVQWMAETGRWPRSKPRVHSMNLVGAMNMRAAIDRYWGRPATGPWRPRR